MSSPQPPELPEDPRAWKPADPFEMPEETDEPFVPPEPPPLPIFAPVTVLATMSSLFGLVLLFYPETLANFLGVSNTFGLLFAAGMMFIGIGALVSRLRNPDPEDDTDLDTGAQV